MLAGCVRVGMPGTQGTSFITLAVRSCCDISAAFHLIGVQRTALINPRMTLTTSHLSLLLA